MKKEREDMQLRRIKRYMLVYYFMRNLEKYKNGEKHSKGSSIYYKYYHFIEKFHFLGRVLISDYTCRFFITVVIRADDEETIAYLISKGYRNSIIRFYGKYLAVIFQFNYYSEEYFSIFCGCYSKFVKTKKVVKKLKDIYV